MWTLVLQGVRADIRGSGSGHTSDVAPPKGGQSLQNSEFTATGFRAIWMTSAFPAFTVTL
jgi:hypothetical protein